MRTLIYQDNWPESWKYSYAYDLLEIYSETCSSGYFYAYTNRRKHTLELVKKIAQPGAKILDVAAGQGNFTLSLAELGYEVTWNDLRGELADYVKLKKENGIIHYAPGNVFTLGFEACFDVILITEIIEHVAYPVNFIKKISQMVKPNGYIIMSTPNGEYFRNRLPKFSECPNPEQFEEIEFKPDADGHIFLLHLNELELLAYEADLSIVETRIFTNPLTNGHIKLGTLLEVLPRKWIEACEKFTCSLPLPFKKKLHTSMIALLNRSPYARNDLQSDFSP